MLFTALIMGVAGSLHCAGMCSPLAMAITNANSALLINRIVYNIGRITMYGLLGTVVAAIGYILPLNNFQNVLSIGFGLALIIMAGAGISGPQIPLLTKSILRLTGALKKIFSRFIHSKNAGALLLLGALNGLLPCGLTFVALSFCLTLTSPLDGFAYMFTFGIGTLPVMLGLVSIAGLVTIKMRWNIRTVASAMMAISGMLLIARAFLIHLPATHQHRGLIDIVICR